MHSNIFFIIASLSLVIFNVLIVDAQNATACPAGLQVCNDVRLGPTCFDPSIYSCPVGSQGSVLCGFQEHGPDGACGTTCYDMVDYVCCNDQLYNAVDNSSPCLATPAVPSSPLTCGTETCLPGYSCCNDVTSLGSTCYDSSIYSCPSGSQGPVLCGFQEHGADGACGTVCYDMVDYVCCNNQLYNALDGSAPCSGTSANPPVTAAPASPPTAVTCGTETCLPGYSCCNDVTALGSTCYDSSIYSCPSGSQGPILCGFQEHGADGACGTVCYDMVDYVCCGDQLYNAHDGSAPCGTAAPTTTPTTPAAPTGCGATLCGASDQCCDDVHLGPVCYNPTTYSCPSGNQGPVLCGFQDHGADGACGTVCYDMEEYLCCNDQLYGAGDLSPCTPAGSTSAPVTV